MPTSAACSCTWTGPASRTRPPAWDKPCGKPRAIWEWTSSLLVGTKNGALGAEAVVFFDKKLGHDFLYLRKQGMQLASKMRFISAQFDALLPAISG